MVAGFGSACAEEVLARSTFDSGDEGWTQVNLGGDYRFLDDMETRTDCPGSPSGVLSFCDPDAGQWMFNAPARFLGNKSAAMDGYIEFSSWNRPIEDGTTLDTDPYPNVLIISGDKAITVLNESPDTTQWTSYRYELNLKSNWLWIDDETPIDYLLPATRDQIQQVLSNITALRIRGEAIVGDDQGWLDDVSLVATVTPAKPTLTIRKVGDEIEISWPSTLTNYALERCGALPGASSWAAVPTGGVTLYRFKAGVAGEYFRLRQSN